MRLAREENARGYSSPVLALPLPPFEHRLDPELMALYYILVVRLVLIFDENGVFFDFESRSLRGQLTAAVECVNL